MVALNHSFYAPKWHLLISYSIERSNSSVKHQCVQSALTLKLRGCSMTHEFCTNHVLTCDFWKYSFPLHVRPCLHVCLDTPLHPSPLGGCLTDTCQQSMVKIFIKWHAAPSLLSHNPKIYALLDKLSPYLHWEMLSTEYFASYKNSSYNTKMYVDWLAWVSRHISPKS